MSYAERRFRRLIDYGPQMVLIAIRRLYSGPAPVLRDRCAIASLVGIFFLVIIGTKPLQIKVTSSATADGDSTRQLLYIAIFVLMLWLSQVHRRPVRLLAFPLTLTLTLLWCGLSLTWSAVPAIAMRRLLLTVMLMWTIFRAVDELGYARTLVMMRASLGAALAANFVAVALSPVAVHQVAELADPNLVGAWRGFLPHKNWAGPLCAVTIIIFLFDGRALVGRRRWLQVATILAAAVFLHMTRSKTAVNLLVGSVAAGALFQRYNPAYRVFVVPVGSVVAMLAVMMVNAHYEQLLAPFWGADRTVLTGRVDIWPVLIRYFNDHPMKGAGFGSFWQAGPNPPINQYTDSWVAKVGNGHNGYLDLLITIGLPGLILTLVAVIVVPLGRLMMSVRLSRAAGGMLMALLVFCVGQNCTETSLLDRDMLMQVFFMLTVAMIYEASRRGDTPWPPTAEAKHAPPRGRSRAPGFFAEEYLR